jgi:hypothetical protein
VPAIPAVLANPDWAWRHLIIGNEPWKALAATLPEADLEFVIRGLVLYGGAGGRTGGSVSPVIVLHRVFVERFPDHHAALTGWIVDHSSNDYEPWGSTLLSAARSLSEVHEIRRPRDADRQLAMAAEEERRIQATARRARDATEKLPNAVRRGDVKAVAALLATGADAQTAADAVGSLVALALEHHRESMAEYLRGAGIR